MPSFTYTGDDERYYPALGLRATPGSTADLDEMPADGRWAPTPKASAPKAAAKTEGA